MKSPKQIPSEIKAIKSQLYRNLKSIFIVNNSSFSEIEFERNWNKPANLTISEAKILKKKKNRGFWKE